MPSRHLTKSKVLLYFCLSFISGIAFASFVAISIAQILIFLVLSIIIISVFWRNKKAVVLGFSVIFLLAGIYRYNYLANSGAANAQEISNIDISKVVSFRGVVISLPEQKTNSVYYEVRPQHLKAGEGETEYKDKILIILPYGSDYHYGDLLEFKGKIKIPIDNSDDFSYKKYLANKGIYFLMSYPEVRFVSGNTFCTGSDLSEGSGIAYNNFECQKYKISTTIFALKFKMIEVINKSMPEPESSLSSAILFGNDDALPKDLIDKFNSTGTRHIMAVSGQNITILVMILLNFIIAVGGSRRIAFYFAFISIVFYIFLIGMPSSAVRAGIMGLLILIAERIGRLSVSYRALVFAATGMLALNPSLLVFDIGFQLSFAATLGIIFIYPILTKYFEKIPNILEIRSSLAMTVAALATTLPVSIVSFNQFSLISPLANILIVPLVPIVMILGFIIIIINSILPILAGIIGWFSWLLLAYEIKMVELLSAFSFSYFKDVVVNGWYIGVYYFFLTIIVLRIRKKEKEN